MAVANGGTRSATPGTGTSFTSASITLSGSNLVLLIGVALNAATQLVNGVSWSLGSGTAYEVINVRTGGSSYLSIWAIPAPVAGAGTYTATLNTSAAYQITGEFFTGADQTTPCVIGDAKSATGSAVTSLTLTPLNLTANDAVFGIGCNTVGGDVSSFSPTQSFLDDTTTVNAEAGYRIGSGSVTANWTNVTGAVQALLAVRVQAAGGVAGLIMAGMDMATMSAVGTCIG